MSQNIEIGENIKTIREAKGLSQSSVVELLETVNINMSRETLSKIETGKRVVSAVELKAMSNVLNIEINDIFPDKEQEDLITFFRKRNCSPNTLEEISKIQDMVKTFINHKKTYEGFKG